MPAYTQLRVWSYVSFSHVSLHFFTGFKGIVTLTVRMEPKTQKTAQEPSCLRVWICCTWIGRPFKKKDSSSFGRRYEKCSCTRSPNEDSHLSARTAPVPVMKVSSIPPASPLAALVNRYEQSSQHQDLQGYVNLGTRQHASLHWEWWSLEGSESYWLQWTHSFFITTPPVSRCQCNTGFDWEKTDWNSWEGMLLHAEQWLLLLQGKRVKLFDQNMADHKGPVSGSKY